MMNSYSHAVSCFERLFGLKFITNAGKMVGCLYHSRNYLIPSAMIYLFTRPRSDQNWTIVAIFGVKLFNHFPTLTESKSVNTALWAINYFPSYYYRRNIASLSLFYRCYYSKSLNILHSLVFPLQTFTSKTHLATSTGLNHHHYLHISYLYEIWR